MVISLICFRLPETFSPVGCFHYIFREKNSVLRCGSDAATTSILTVRLTEVACGCYAALGALEIKSAVALAAAADSVRGMAAALDLPPRVRAARCMKAPRHVS